MKVYPTAYRAASAYAEKHGGSDDLLGLADRLVADGLLWPIKGRADGNYTEWAFRDEGWFAVDTVTGGVLTGPCHTKRRTLEVLGASRSTRHAPEVFAVPMGEAYRVDHAGTVLVAYAGKLIEMGYQIDRPREYMGPRVEARKIRPRR